MNFLKNIKLISLCLIITCDLVLVNACQSDNDLPENKVDQVQLISTIESDFHINQDSSEPSYLLPREYCTVEVTAKDLEKLPEKTTYSLAITQNSGGNYIQTFVEEKDFCVGTVRVDLQFENEGGYTIECDLYDTDDFKSLGLVAPILGTIEHQVIVQECNFKVEYEVLGEGAFRFIPNTGNHKFNSYYYKFDFGDGTGEKQFGPDFVPDKEITHEYKSGGVYKVNAKLIETRLNFPLTYTTEFSVEVGLTFSLVVPSPPLKVGQDYTFKATTSGLLPPEPSYEWDFGDGPKMIIPFTNEVTHVFEKEGSYVVHVEIFESDREAASILGSAMAQVEVNAVADHLTEIHEMRKFSLDFAVQHDYTDVGSGKYTWDFDSHGDVVWNGVDFSMQWEQYGHSEVMNGRVSEDGTIIEQLKIRHEFKASNGETQWFEIEIADLPFWTDTMPDRFIVDVHGEEVEKFVPYFNTYRTAGFDWTKDARLYVRFEK